MNDLHVILLGMGMFTTVILVLVALILAARSIMVGSGNVTININDDPDKKIQVPIGGKLLQTLASKSVFLSSACGGGGTCAQCRCKVISGGGSALATERPHLTRKRVA